MKKIKKTLIMLVALMVCFMIVPVSSNAETVKLSKKSVIMAVGTTKQLKLKGVPTAKVKWSTTKKAVVTVTQKGKVTAKKAGTTNVKAKYEGKTYKCKVVVKKTSNDVPENKTSNDVPENKTTTPAVKGNGNVTGNVTYHYNQYKGYVADTNAIIWFVPKDGSAKKYTTSYTSYMSWIYGSDSIEQEAYSYGIRTSKVDGLGNYMINNIAEGEYKVLIISKNCTSKRWFDNKDLYYKSISDQFLPYLNNVNAELLGQSVSCYETCICDVTIYKGQTSTCSYAFPYTYI